MNSFRRVALAATVLLAATGSAMSADFVPVVDEATFFDFDGPYVNVALVGTMDAFGLTDSMFGVSGTVGLGGTMSQIYFGAEANAAIVISNGDTIGALSTNARLGLVVNDNALVYTVGGIGALFLPGNDTVPYFYTGLGAEYAITDSMTIRAQYQFDMAPVALTHVGKVGVSWYF